MIAGKGEDFDMPWMPLDGTTDGVIGMILTGDGGLTDDVNDDTMNGYVIRSTGWTYSGKSWACDPLGVLCYGPPQTIITNVDALNFVYLDEDGSDSLIRIPR